MLSLNVVRHYRVDEKNQEEGNGLLRWEVASIYYSSEQLPTDRLSLKGLSHLSCIISTALGALLRVEIRELTTT